MLTSQANKKSSYHRLGRIGFVWLWIQFPAGCQNVSDHTSKEGFSKDERELTDGKRKLDVSFVGLFLPATKRWKTLVLVTGGIATATIPKIARGDTKYRDNSKIPHSGKFPVCRVLQNSNVKWLFSCFMEKREHTKVDFLFPTGTWAPSVWIPLPDSLVTLDK